MAALCLGLMQLTRHSFALGPSAIGPMVNVHVVLFFAVIANVILAAFNLTPIPPLDGSKIWPCLFSKMKPAFSPALRQLSLIILIVIISTRALSPAIGAVVNTVAGIMPETDSDVFDDHCNAAMAEMKAGRPAQAEKALDEAIALNAQSADCLCQRAAARAAQQKWPAAADDIRRALELDKGNKEYQALRAEIQQHLPPQSK
jgi:tetratricopeptide (TPR) repeat protein